MRRVEAVLVALLSSAVCAHAEAPRWVTGPPYFTAASGNPVVWYTTAPLYFTDPGDLSATVTHAAADALVAAAAGVWNVPTSAMEVTYGGALAEHVSSANSYRSSSGPVFPADVGSANYAAVQIAVIYDSDGSVTDMLLGSGASSPAECPQNGVTESVDAITPAGLIQHAILVLNGRCTGPAPEQQMQLQYQLERAFGRVLGVGWSQTNDNVFTRAPQPTAVQALHWPIMHPIDIVCGPYTYQCLPQPFTLRDDDVAAISALYPMVVYGSFPPTPPAPGKVWSYTQASKAYGTVSFPTGQGMAGVNVVLQRLRGGQAAAEGFQDVSSVSGFAFQQDAGNPVTGAATGMTASMGSPGSAMEGHYSFGWIPDIDLAGANNGAMLGVLSTEAINPLYVGTHAVGPYVAEGVTPSGSSPSQTTQYALQPYLEGWDAIESDFAPQNAAGDCPTGSDGTETAPQPVAAGGWWTGVLCTHGHTAWSSFAMQAGRTATLEVMALDESGLATTAKAMPLIGVWAGGDATGTLPTLAATPSAFNTVALGTTAVGVATTLAGGLRFVIADARGDGRPDFAYQARVLYADSVTPAATSVNGGPIAITGTGFRQGNAVTVNGVAATVESWTASAIVAVAPAESAFAVKPTGPVDVAVVDLTSGGSTVMTGALTYSAGVVVDPSAWRLVVVSGAGQAVTAGGTFAPVVVRVTDSGGDPVAGAAVSIYQTVDAEEMACPTRGRCPIAPVLAASTASAISDANGLVSVAPMQVAGVGEVTNLAMAAGTQGFVSLALIQGP
jgi:hypothetical protein